MSCCGGKGTPRPKPCADGRLPFATPDAIALAHAKELDLCARQGQGSGARGYITKADVERWTS